MMQRWQQLSKSAQRGWIAAAVVVGLLITINGLNSIGGRPSGPSLSSYATSGQGLAALDSLLAANGYATTQARVPLDQADVTPASTVIALGQTLSSKETAAMRSFLQRGGRVVTGGPESEIFLRTFAQQVRWRGDGRARLTPAAHDAVVGLRSVRADGIGAWEDAPGSPLFVGAGQSAGFELAVGRGTIVALADPTPLTNEWLAQADNAGFAVAVIGAAPRTVVFAESGHGYGLDSGLGALPARWKTALWFAAIAGLLGALAAGKRFGPIDAEPEAPAPERTRYVEALASTLARTRDLDAASAPLRARGTALVMRRAGRSPEAPDDLAAAARLAGLTAEEIRSLTEPISTDADLVALGRTVSRIEEH